MKIKVNFKTTVIVLLLTCLPLLTQAKVANDDHYKLRQLYMRVESDIKRNITSSYYLHKKQLQKYPLFPYLKYEMLKKIVHRINLREMQDFTSTYADSPLADKFRVIWLKDRANRGRWSEFLKGYKDFNDDVLACHKVNAELKTFKNKNEAYKKIPKLWLNGKSMPKACDPVFAKWANAKKQTKQHVWDRIKLAINARNHKLAIYLSKKLPKAEQRTVDLWLRVDDKPKLIANKKLFRVNKLHQEILLHGIMKIARNDPALAVKHWKRLVKKYKFNEIHYNKVTKQIAVSLSLKNHKDAPKWLAKVKPQNQDQTVLNSKLRFAIANSNFAKITEIYQSLPKDKKTDDKWQYWYARSLLFLGHTKEGNKLLEDLSTVRSYYGFLASSRIRKPYSFLQQQLDVSNEQLLEIARMPAIARARELILVKAHHLANSEWHNTIKKLSNEKKQAAAKLANSWDAHNMAILALARSNNKNDLNLRFPQSYSSIINREAKKNKLDPAMIFALTRQESAFMEKARSPAGALGLMQLMPSTAKMVAKDMKIKYQNKRMLLNPNNNIKLGCRYLSMMLEKNHKNPAIAAAAYNAGPTRVKKWYPKRDMPVDMWIETIPYYETRNYVQNVLAYTVIYQELLGKRPNLSKNMPTILGTNREIG